VTLLRGLIRRIADQNSHGTSGLTSHVAYANRDALRKQKRNQKYHAVVAAQVSFSKQPITNRCSL